MSHFLVTLAGVYLFAWLIYAWMYSAPLAEVLRRFFLTTGSVMIVLILVEAPAALRMIDYRAVFGSMYSGNALTVVGRHADAQLLWQHDPYYSYEEAYQGNLGRALCAPPDPSRPIVVQYDRHGFRNREDLDRADLVVIGDSYIEGYMTPETHLVTTLLGQLTGKAVANLGHSGYGPQQELIVLKRYGLPLHPSTVIWAFFEGNDFSEAETYARTATSRRHPLWQDLWYRSMTRNLLALMQHRVNDCTPHPIVQDFQGTFVDQHGIATPVFFAPLEIRPHPLSASVLHKALAPIGEAAALCQALNIEFIVAFVPDKYRVYHDLPNVQLNSDSLYVHAVSTLPVELGRRLAQLNGAIRYVDLTPALKAAASQGIATYLGDDTHWTEAGHRVAAETLLQMLSAVTDERPAAHGAGR